MEVKNEVQHVDGNGSKVTKLKGIRGAVHNLKNKVKGIGKNIFKAGQEGKRNMFAKLLLKLLVLVKFLIPALLFLALVNFVVAVDPSEKLDLTISNYFSSNDSAGISGESKENYEKYGSLIFATNEDIKKMSDEYLEVLERRNELLHRYMSKDGEIGDHKISDIDYLKDFNISNAYEFILNAERINFNRVKWNKMGRDGQVSDMELQQDETTKLWYPKNDEDTDTTKDIRYFGSMIRPLLQSYVIPSAMLSGANTVTEKENAGNFVFQIIDKGYHPIEVMQYTLQNATREQTKRHYIDYSGQIQIWEKTATIMVDEEQDDGTVQKVPKEVTHYGYVKSDLLSLKKKAKEKYQEAANNSSENVDIINSSDATVRKEFMYPVIKADTFKKFLRAEYEQKMYNEEDVQNFTNAKTETIVNAQEYDKILTSLPSEELLNGLGWSRSEMRTIKIRTGEDITTNFYWTDELNSVYTEERDYEVDDISNYVNGIENIVEVKSSDGTEEVKTAGNRPDLRVKAKDIFSNSEIEYYKELENDKDINRFDMINASPSIYKDYLSPSEKYSEYIGFSRAKLTLSYSLLNKYLKVEDLTLNLSSLFAFGSSSQDYTSDIYIGGISGTGMIWPITNYGTITSVFGIARPEIGQSHDHSGVDIGPGGDNVYGKSYTGSYVLAAYSGTVVEMFKEVPRDKGNANSRCPDTAQGANYTCGGVSSYGRHVKIKNDNGYTTVYGHLYEVADGIEVGSHIERGQIIGVMGTTGSSTGVHLHFEVRKSPGNFADRINPLSIVDISDDRESLKNNPRVPNKSGKVDVNTGASGSSTGSGVSSSGKYVFSQEIKEAISKASLATSTFSRTLTKSGSYYKTTKITENTSTAYSAHSKPSSNDAKDAAIRKMSDLEILSRAIYGEQGSNSEEAGILVAITILNKSKSSKTSIATVLTSKYSKRNSVQL